MLRPQKRCSGISTGYTDSLRGYIIVATINILVVSYHYCTIIHDFHIDYAINVMCKFTSNQKSQQPRYPPPPPPPPPATHKWLCMCRLSSEKQLKLSSPQNPLFTHGIDHLIGSQTMGFMINETTDKYRVPQLQGACMGQLRFA